MAAAVSTSFHLLPSSTSTQQSLSANARFSFPSSLVTTAITSSPSLTHRYHLPTLVFSNGGNGSNFGGGSGSNFGGGSGGGSGGEEGDNGDESRRRKNKADAVLALAELGRTVGTVPVDLAAAIEAGRIPMSVVRRFVEMEKSKVLSWLMKFGGFRERLLADDLFLAKVAMECGVGIFAKTAAEWERRRENFIKEIDFVIADVVMAIIADFMLVWLPAPTVSLRAPLSLSAGPIAKFFFSCPDNAFQVALGGASYKLLQRIGSIVRNGSKLFLVGTGSSLIGTGITNALIKSRKAFGNDMDDEVEDVPLLSTSIAYGAYMAVSANLRYQLLAGVVEQRILEPLLHQRKLLLSALCFAVRTGNTYLGSLMWVDYARLVGIQKIRE